MFTAAPAGKPRRTPPPTLKDATDAIVRITKTTICGTDLHIHQGDVPTVAPGRCKATKAWA
nr:alcohol dehydrogenase catalytic domain-containing protein [Zoogloea sp.]